MKIVKVVRKADATVNLRYGSRTGDNWTVGTATINGVVYDFHVKHFDEPSVFGINHGRISKFWLRRQGEARAVLSFDRGWEPGHTLRGKDADVMSVYKVILSKFN